MLARTPNSLVYLSAEELGITERERAGLIEVRDDLASGRLKHVPLKRRIDQLPLNSHPDRNAPVFNMEDWQGSTDCGTCHCIGGFMQARGVYLWGGDIETMRSDALEFLFTPRTSKIERQDYQDLTPAQAVRAIDLFMTGAGSDCWPMALADIPA